MDQHWKYILQYILHTRDGNIYSPSHFQKETTLIMKKRLQKHNLAPSLAPVLIIYQQNT